MRGLHILLTGESGVGKSFLVQRLLASCSLCVNGFYTKKMELNPNGQSKVIIRSANHYLDNQLRLQSVLNNQVGLCLENGSVTSFPDVFDNLGCRFLHGESTELWVMDELGFMELGAMRFRRRVIEILDGDVPVIAVIKNKNNEFLDLIRRHEAAKLYEVTIENRDRIFEVLSRR